MATTQTKGKGADRESATMSYQKTFLRRVKLSEGGQL
jgi:hypothetical protein